MLRLLIAVFSAFFLFAFLFPSRAAAQEYRTDYRAEYILSIENNQPKTLAKFTIKITNLKSDVYVKRFTLTFPESFPMSQLKAQDDAGEIQPNLVKNPEGYTIELEFTSPKIGKETANTFYLQFEQKNLFQLNGNVWEIILPTIENKNEGDYQVIVNIPNRDKKISIAKPKPDLIQGGQIYWSNPKTKTVYAVFGEKQIYRMNLVYNLKNQAFTPVYTDIAFPPDTLFQKVYVEKIKPEPTLTYIDDDGNFMGRYYLKPREEKVVQFESDVEIFAFPREEVRATSSKRIAFQKRYLLNEAKYWKIERPERFSQLKTVKDIYYFLAQNFHYDYSRVTQNLGRLGANAALKKPDQVVCTEFSDSFVAMAREQGIYAREVQGFGFSQDSQLRPLSLVQDVLHSWPEYYDETANLWVQLDPTWENTSGIDYFTSFDLNHIAFAIHGKNPDYPLPAGMYKTKDTRDVSVRPSQGAPLEKSRLSIQNVKTAKRINDTSTHTGKLTIQNLGNVFAYNIPLTFHAKNIEVSQEQQSILALAPFEEKEIEFYYKAAKNARWTKGSIDVTLGEQTSTADIFILPYSYNVGIILAGIFITASLFILVPRKLARKRSSHP